MDEDGKSGNDGRGGLTWVGIRSNDIARMVPVPAVIHFASVERLYGGYYALSVISGEELGSACARLTHHS